MERNGILMSKETDLIFVNEAKSLLEQAADLYSVIPNATIERIRNVIIELEDILEEEE